MVAIDVLVDILCSINNKKTLIFLNYLVTKIISPMINVAVVKINDNTVHFDRSVAIYIINYLLIYND